MTGYKGRLGLYELLVMTEAVRNCIEQGGTLGEMERAAPAGCTGARGRDRLV